MSNKEWCSHMINAAEGWSFCPICGMKRPVEKTLRERLAKRLIEANNYLELADVAIKFFEENR
jgi:hypothetical protein